MTCYVVIKSHVAISRARGLLGEVQAESYRIGAFDVAQRVRHRGFIRAAYLECAPYSTRRRSLNEASVMNIDEFEKTISSWDKSTQHAGSVLKSLNAIRKLMLNALYRFQRYFRQRKNRKRPGRTGRQNRKSPLSMADLWESLVLIRDATPSTSEVAHRALENALTRQPELCACAVESARLWFHYAPADKSTITADDQAHMEIRQDALAYILDPDFREHTGRRDLRIQRSSTSDLTIENVQLANIELLKISDSGDINLHNLHVEGDLIIKGCSAFHEIVITGGSISGSLIITEMECRTIRILDTAAEKILIKAAEHAWHAPGVECIQLNTVMVEEIEVSATRVDRIFVNASAGDLELFDLHDVMIGRKVVTRGVSKDDLLLTDVQCHDEAIENIDLPSDLRFSKDHSPYDGYVWILRLHRPIRLLHCHNASRRSRAPSFKTARATEVPNPAGSSAPAGSTAVSSFLPS